MIQVTPKTIRRNLNNAIKAISKSSEQYVRHPTRDFTRKRKLPFELVLKLLVSMGGNTLCKELNDWFEYSQDILHLRCTAVPALKLAMDKGHAAQGASDGEMPQYDGLSAVGIHAEASAARAFTVCRSDVHLALKADNVPIGARQ